jgi:hypothetical protein
VAGSEEIDRLDALSCGTRNTDADGGRADDALGISYGASFDVVVVSDAVFYGGGQPLSIFEFGRAVREKKKA